MAKSYTDVNEIINILFSSNTEERLGNERNGDNDSEAEFIEDVANEGEEIVDSE